jgi:hypothetical protein
MMSLSVLNFICFNEVMNVGTLLQSNFLLNRHRVSDSSKTEETLVFFPLHERPLQEKRRSADAEVAGMAWYCNAIGARVGNLPIFSFQK